MPSAIGEEPGDHRQEEIADPARRGRGRYPSRAREAAPQIHDDDHDDGGELRAGQNGLNAAAGRPPK